MSERVAIFIDGQNLFHMLRDGHNRIDLDFELFAEKLVGDRKLIRAYYYAALPKQSDDAESYKKQQGFLDALQVKNYFTVRKGRLERRGDTFVEKGVDVALAVDMLEMGYNNSFDTAILVSGDGDLSKAVASIKRIGKHVENVCASHMISKHLQQTCDVFNNLDEEFLRNCWR